MRNADALLIFLRQGKSMAAGQRLWRAVCGAIQPTGRPQKAAIQVSGDTKTIPCSLSETDREDSSLPEAIRLQATKATKAVKSSYYGN